MTADRWVLVTDGTTGQNRSALAAVRAAAMAGYLVAVTVSGPRSLAAASLRCHRRVSVPPAGDRAYADQVRTELATSTYSLVLPASDAAILALGLPGATLVDKATLAATAAAAGVQQPTTVTVESEGALREAVRALGGPVVVKPTRKPATASASAVRVEDIDAVTGLVTDWSVPYAVQPFVDAPLRAIAGVVREGRLLASVHQRYLRTWPTPCGVASAAETVEPDAEIEGRVLRLLDGYDGIFQAQLAGDLLLDVNPRVYGSLPLAVASGVNLVDIAARAAAGDRVPEQRARPGVRYRWVDGDLRHILAARWAGGIGWRETLAALRPRAGTVHSIESWRDPMPAVVRLWQLARR